MSGKELSNDVEKTTLPYKPIEEEDMVEKQSEENGIANEEKVRVYYEGRRAKVTSDTNDCFRFDAMKESVEDKHLGDFLIDTHEASFAYSFDVEAKKVFGDIDVNLLKAPLCFVNSKSLLEFMEV
ncbi:hypothetical protein PanWU01x14_114170 [Parasponia andersonii]|uniref:Uncharacterized protein n=1 Tax=Parasponia andersonii TaxID=3476 RepID=A0A2P5CXA6_PARAD|nr:hypothetical protein PanWU01x14_114170 [Parasponia andersonii]